MTTEEKAKAYDEAIKKAESLYKASEPMSGCNVIIETLFPELKESEDERIRKELIKLVKNHSELCGGEWCIGDFTENELISWLEKQGEQTPAELAKGEDYGIDGLWHAQRILEKTFGKVDGYQTDDGILSHECAISAVKELYEKKPAWSEEDEHRIKDTVYFLDTAKKHYASTEELDACIDWLKSLKDRVQPKQEWSEEDKYMYDILCGTIKNTDINENTKYKLISWLKSIRPQNKWKPSDEQMEALYTYIYNPQYFNSPDPRMELVESVYKDLKKLKEE